jgi:anti-anti-sigma factor
VSSAFPETELPLTVNQHFEDDIAILDIEGPMTLAPALSTLRDTVKDILSRPDLGGLLLRVAGVTATDSAGLGELTVVYTLAARRGCPVRLTDVSPSLQRMLELTRLDGLLLSAPDIATAKKQLKS